MISYYCGIQSTKKLLLNKLSVDIYIYTLPFVQDSSTVWVEELALTHLEKSHLEKSELEDSEMLTDRHISAVNSRLEN